MTNLKPPVSNLGPPADLPVNPYDGTAAQLVPLPVEKLPLFRWRPGARLLVVGSRDGATAEPDLARAEGTSFRRTLSPEMVAAALDKSGAGGICLAWSTTLLFPQAVAICLQARCGAIVACTSGHGDPALLDALLPVVDAWQLVLGPSPGPLAGRILAGSAHVEVLALWRDPAGPLPPIDLGRARAVHLAPLDQAHAEESRMLAAHGAARDRLPADVPLYDEAHRRDDCPCGATLVWRAAGRSRIDALAPDGRCSACGRSHAFTLG